MTNRILVINPGSTSTKVSVFDQQTGEETHCQVIRHATAEITRFERIFDQLAFRRQLILDFLAQEGIELTSLIAVVGRGGLLRPIPGGTYEVNEAMIADLRSEKYNVHASNLGAILADDIARSNQIKAYIVDPVVVDELQPEARISGLAGLQRRSVLHALNQKAVARAVLAEQGRTYEDSNLIVAHLGGGTSLAAHKRGRMIEVINGLDGEGPFTPERTGELPLYDFAQLIIENQWTMAEVKKTLAGDGGLKSYTGETDIRELIRRIDAGEDDLQPYIDAMAYQIAKAIGEMAVVLQGKVDAIILTGGVAYSSAIVRYIQAHVEWIAPVYTRPGEMEMRALFEGVNRILTNQEAVKHY